MTVAANTPRFAAFRKRAYTLPQLGTQLRTLVARRRDISAIWQGRIDPALREQIMIAVARVNGCRYCAFVHTRFAELEGVSDDELARLDGLDPAAFDRDEWLAIAYATALAEADFGSVDDELGSEIERRSGPQRSADIESVALAMTLANRTANTLDAFRSRLSGSPDPEGRAFDEAVISAVLIATGPLTVIGLSIPLRMSPIRFVREIIRLQQTP